MSHFPMDRSLLQGFEMRLRKNQPLSSPSDIERFFVSEVESGIICLFSTLLGGNNEILFPYNSREIKLTGFRQIAFDFLRLHGKQGVECYSEEEARQCINTLDLERFWPVNVFETDTVGEKPFEEFYTDEEELILGKFEDLASIQFNSTVTDDAINRFQHLVASVDLSSDTASQKLIDTLSDFVPTFQHLSGTKFLNGRM